MTTQRPDQTTLDPHARTAEMLSPLAANRLHELTATAAVAAMKSGDISAEDYAQALITRADRLTPLNAFRTFRPDAVLEAARRADAQRASGAALGALHGLPIPVKDSINVDGYPTSNGTATLRDFVPRRNAAVVSSLLDHGAVIMGKTNLHELSLGWTSVNATYGAVHNPYDQTRIPGGSSGGSAVAVSARIAPAAVAEDTLGSIRIPSSMCGICGLRPTYGRYPNDGVMPLTSDKFDQIGMVARTVEDLALFDSVITGDTTPVPMVDLRGVRVGVADFFYNDLESDVERVAAAALDRLRDAGATIVRTDLPPEVKAAHDVAMVLLISEVGPAIGQYLASEGTGVSFEQMAAQLGPDLAALFSMPLPPREAYDAMLAQRTKTNQALRAFFADQRLDVLAFPPAMIPPSRMDEDGSMTVRGEVLPMTTTMGRNVSLSSCASLASLVLPAGLTAAGLPIGLELDAPSGNDRRLLGLGIAAQRALGPVAPPRV